VTDTLCPHCGEPVEPRQLVCLSCGGRVALREPTPLAREPTTALVAVLLTVIVIGAGLFGFAISELTSGDGDSGAGGGSGSARTSARAEEPEVEAPSVVSGTKQRKQDQAPPRERGVPGWPKDLRAHTVVLVTSGDRAAALAVAKDARSSGLEAGMLRSDDYNLGTGFWIVFSGQFTTREGAARQARQLADRYPGAYPQLVQSSQ
jgi:hypothetical protein